MNLVVQAALIFGVFQALRKRKASIGACISRGLSRLLPVLAIAVLIGVLVFGGFLPAVALFVAGSPGGGLLCMLASIPVAVYIAMTYFVAVPVAVVEQVGIGAALQRSAKLTSGVRLRIFATWFVFAVLTGIASMMCEKVLEASGEPAIYLGGTFAVQVLTTSLMAVLPAVN